LLVIIIGGGSCVERNLGRKMEGSVDRLGATKEKLVGSSTVRYLSCCFHCVFELFFLLLRLGDSDYFGVGLYSG
jgi:hypothetical protein